MKVTYTIRGFSSVLISLSNNDVKFMKTFNEFKVYFISVMNRANHGPAVWTFLFRIINDRKRLEDSKRLMDRKITGNESGFDGTYRNH